MDDTEDDVRHESDESSEDRMTTALLVVVVTVLAIIIALVSDWIEYRLGIEMMPKLSLASTVSPPEASSYLYEDETLEQYLMMEDLKRNLCHMRGPEFVYACLRWYPRPRDADVPKSAPYSRSAFLVSGSIFP